MRTLLVVGVSIVLSILNANAQTSAPTEWKFQFRNGAVASFSPEDGVFFKAADSEEFGRVHAKVLKAFESTTTAFPRGEATIQIKPTWQAATVHRAESTEVAFYFANDGIWALSQWGNRVHVATMNDLGYGKEGLFEPHPDLIIPGAGRFRAIVLRSQTVEKTFDVRLVVLDQWLNRQSVELKNLPSATGSKHAEVLSHDLFDNRREIIELKLSVDDHSVGARAFVDEWSRADAFQSFETQLQEARIASKVTDFYYYQALETVGENTSAQDAQALATLTELRKVAKSTRRPSRLQVRNRDLQPIVNAVNRQAHRGEIAGVVAYHPISSKNADDIDQWIAESREVSEAMKETGLVFMIYPPEGNAWVVYHPKGKGKFLETTLHECNLAMKGPDLAL